MKKALIIVQGENNPTKKFGEEIAEFLLGRGLSAELVPIDSFEPKKLEGADYLLLSGWRNGALFSPKNPDNEWAAFVKKLPTLKGIKTALFTSYKLFSGGMLRRMKKYIGKKTENLDFAFTSRDGSLSISDKLTLNEFIK
ncbi:MAG: flavodoxin family protein [Ignavibacteriaceae bacterium]|nr:flavodoxin family protein [Ignavibacteriaceae bacterium]